MERYSVINEKRKREIVLLRGAGCVYRQCAFCDYYHDASPDSKENFLLNSEVLSLVTGKYGELEVINSGSVFELDNATLTEIQRVCREKKIHTIHFESHHLYRDRIPALRKSFGDFQLKMKLGLETFDFDLRENVLKKGIRETDPEIISKDFEEANFLFGIAGQTAESMKRDIQLGLKYFERICINIMCKNSSLIAPDEKIIEEFLNKLYPKYKDDERIDILIANTDFGVGD